MKKFSMAMLIALMGAGFVTACGSDSDDDNSNDANACQEVKCDAVANADGVAKGEDCACEYTCKSGFVEVEGGNGAFACEEPEADKCKEVKCDAIANADGVAKGEDCACEYTCKSGFDKVDGANGSFTCEASAEEDEAPCKDFAGCEGVSLPYVCTPTEDEAAEGGCKAVLSCGSDYTKVDDADNANGFRCLLPDNAICLGDDECISGNCEVVDDETRKCAPKSDGGEGEGEGGGSDAKACDPSDANACGADGLCIANVCKTADDFNFKEGNSYSDSDYCFGKVRVSCEMGDTWDMYTKTTCSEGCELKGGKASCIGEGEDY